MTQTTTILTDRQKAVLELLAKRRPYKVIAAELGISETRVKQHVRVLKDRLDANSMPELVDRFDDLAEAAPFPKRAGPKLEDVSATMFAPRVLPDDPGAIQLGDSFNFQMEAPWLRPDEPRIVPGVLNGGHAALRRFLVILVLAAAMLSVVALGLTAAQVLSDLLSGVAAAPAD